MNNLSHLDVNTTGYLTTAQSTKIKAELLKLAEDTDFADVSFYLNLDYIGGRPNDRG